MLHGLAGLLVLTAGLIGLPVFLVTAHRQLNSLLPALGDVPSTLLAPEDGGLFLLSLFGIGWLCWLVFVLAFVLEVGSRIRGIRTPRLGPFLPQRTAAWAVTAVTLLASLSPAGGQLAPSPPAVSASAPAAIEPPRAGLALVIDSAQLHDAAPSRASGKEAAHVDADGVPWRDYRVKRGDTLWDIADQKLGEPTRWPVIAEASDDILQPHGRRLEDPDLILPGWTLHVPRAKDDRATDSDAGAKAGTSAPDRSASAPSPPAADPRPPTTPLRPAEQSPSTPSGRGAAAGSIAGNDDLPRTPLTPPALDGLRLEGGPHATPLNPAVTSGKAEPAVAAAELSLPPWVLQRLTPVAFEDAPDETRARVISALAATRGQAPRLMEGSG
jgi:hypothetical protein